MQHRRPYYSLEIKKKKKDQRIIGYIKDVKRHLYRFEKKNELRAEGAGGIGLICKHPSSIFSCSNTFR